MFSKVAGLFGILTHFSTSFPTFKIVSVQCFYCFSRYAGKFQFNDFYFTDDKLKYVPLLAD